MTAINDQRIPKFEDKDCEVFEEKEKIKKDYFASFDEILQVKVRSYYDDNLIHIVQVLSSVCKKEILKRSLTGLMAAAIVLTGVQTPVQADNLQDEVTLHAGATAVMNGAHTEETEQKTDYADLQAGAALYLEKDGEELAEAETEVDAGAAIEEALEEMKATHLVMANVSDAVNV